MLHSVFWNPAWNEYLFIVSCAERIMEKPTPHSVDAIMRYVEAELSRTECRLASAQVQFRLVFVHRAEGRLHREVVFVSDAFELRTGQKC
ncbi:MAG: hypothetical protein AAF943_09075 [Pseudomonadota bacterium]